MVVFVSSLKTDVEMKIGKWRISYRVILIFDNSSCYHGSLNFFPKNWYGNENRKMVDFLRMIIRIADEKLSEKV